jgi:hypothetical protein
MNDFLDFRKMITPTIIKIIFWIGAGGAVLFGIILMIAGAAASAASSQSGFGGGVGLPGPLLVFLGLLQIVFGPLLVRISCELTILFFRIYETLTEIRDGGGVKLPAVAYPSAGPQPMPVFPQP